MKSKTDISEHLEKCRERLSRLCINLCRDHHDAADLFQDTCLRALRYYKTYDDSQEFDKWIFRICVNTYKSTLRHLYKSRPLLFASNDEHDEFFNMIPEDDDTATHEEYKELLKTVKHLPEKYRTVVVLRYFNDYSEKETAEILGIPTGTVKSRLNAAKTLIRKGMEHEE